MKSDPIDMAVTLIENHRPFVLALVIGVAGLATEYAGDMTIFAPNGTVLAGGACGLLSAKLLRERVEACFASEFSTVVDFDLTGSSIGASETSYSGSMRIYMEAVFPRKRLWQSSLARVI